MLTHLPSSLQTEGKKGNCTRRNGNIRHGDQQQKQLYQTGVRWGLAYVPARQKYLVFRTQRELLWSSSTILPIIMQNSVHRFILDIVQIGRIMEDPQ